MKALTIYQPWSSLVVAGAKPYEFRGWSPRERGGSYAALIGQRIVIHAASRPMRAEEVGYIASALERGDDELVCLHSAPALETLRPLLGQIRPVGLPLSAGLGTAILGEPRNGFEIAEEFGLERCNDSDRDEHANWGWPMLDVERWETPVPMRGYQGFWSWPEPGSVGL